MSRETLPYSVEVQWPDSPRWERIAAFDCLPPARNYARACAEACRDRGTDRPDGKLHEYRVVYRRRRLELHA